MALSLSFQDPVLTIVDDTTRVEWMVRIANGRGLSSNLQLGLLADGWAFCATGQSIITLANYATRQIRTITCRLNDTRIDTNCDRDFNVGASKDGRSLFVVAKFEGYMSRKFSLFVIDVLAGQVTSAFHDLEGAPYHQSPLAQLPDGRVAVSVRVNHPNGSIGFVYVDPSNGQLTSDLLPSDWKLCFQGPSPDGTLWAIPDRRQIQIKEELPSIIDIDQGQEPNFYVGLSLQIWRSAPLTYLTSIVTTWLPLSELPLADYNWNELGSKDEVKRSIYTILSKALSMANLEYSESLNAGHLHDYFEQEDLKFIDPALDTLQKFLNLYQSIVWREDGKAVWTCVNWDWSCAYLDGTSSPRFQLNWLDRLGKIKEQRFLFGGGRISVGKNSDANLLFDGSNNFFAKIDLDGSPVPRPWQPKQIDIADDATFEKLQEAKKDLKRQRDAFCRTSSIVVVPIRSLEFDDVIAAIRATRDAVTEQFLLNTFGDQGGFSYQFPDRVLSERAFFEHVSNMDKLVAGPLSEVVEAYLRLVDDSYAFYFSNGEESAGILGYAVTALAKLDTKYLNQVRRYAQTLDRGLEMWFAQVTFPSIISKHGWTDEVIDFAIWVMQMSFYNSLQDYSVIWNQYGMGKAVQVRFTPQQFADRLEEVISRSGKTWNSFDITTPPDQALAASDLPITGTRFPMTDQLERNLRGTMDDWTRALFELLRPRLRGDADKV